MTWTYEEFNNQPDWLIKVLLIKWNEEGKYSQEQSNRK